MYEVALGAEAWAADFLRKDAQESQTDHLGETWAKPMPPMPIGEGIGVVEGRLEDMQGRFNINSLVTVARRHHESRRPSSNSSALLAMLEIEPKWADRHRRLDRFRRAIQDFPTARKTVPIPDRIRRTSPRTCRSRARASCMVLPGFGIERYRKLQPFITALPVGRQTQCVHRAGRGHRFAVERSGISADGSRGPCDASQGACFPTLEDLREHAGAG